MPVHYKIVGNIATPILSHKEVMRCLYSLHKVTIWSQTVLIQYCTYIKRTKVLCLAFFPFTHTFPSFHNIDEKDVENIVGKGENAGNQHFLLFLQCFLPFHGRIVSLYSEFDLSSANACKLGFYRACELVFLVCFNEDKKTICLRLHVGCIVIQNNSHS